MSSSEWTNRGSEGERDQPKRVLIDTALFKFNNIQRVSLLSPFRVAWVATYNIFILTQGYWPNEIHFADRITQTPRITLKLH